MRVCWGWTDGVDNKGNNNGNNHIIMTTITIIANYSSSKVMLWVKYFHQYPLHFQHWNKPSSFNDWQNIWEKKAESSSIFLRTYPIYHSLLNTRVSLTCRTARPWGHLKRVVSWAREGRAVCHIALHASIPALALGAWYRRPEVPIVMQGRPFLAWHCWLTGSHKKRNNNCNRVNDSVTITKIVQQGFCSEGEWYRNNSSEEGLMHECFDSPNGARHR